MALDYRDEIWVVILIVLSAIGFVIGLALWIFTLFKIVSMEIRTRNLWLSQLSLFFIFLSFGTCFIFVPQPNIASCAAARFLPGVCYSGLFTGLMLKLLNIISESRNIYIPAYYQAILFLALVIVQVAIGAQWLILVPPDLVVVDSPMDGSELLLCSVALEDIILSLVYEMLLIFALCIMTTVARRTTVVHREEAFLLSVCVGFIVPIWIAWALLGTIGSRKYNNYEDACYAFGLLATASVVLILVYLPRARHLSKLSRTMARVTFERNVQKQVVKPYVVNPNPGRAPSAMATPGLIRSPLNHSMTSLHSMSQFSPGQGVPISILTQTSRTDDKRLPGHKGAEGRVYLGPQSNRLAMYGTPRESKEVPNVWAEDDGTHL